MFLYFQSLKPDPTYSHLFLHLFLSDLVRLYDFLAGKNKQAAAYTLQSLSSAPERLLDQSRIGEKLDEFYPREVRRIVVGQYEIRYEIQESIIVLLRIWHTREYR